MRLVDKELERYRAKPFLDEAYVGVRQFDRDLIELLRQFDRDLIELLRVEELNRQYLYHILSILFVRFNASSSYPRKHKRRKDEANRADDA